MPKKNIDFIKLLAPRIENNCLEVYKKGLYPDTARRAMIQVELALKEKGHLGREYCGTKLIKRVVGGRDGIALKVPLGDDLQDEAQKYFESVFSYYRNYVAHDGNRIDERSSLRILIIASELLEMLDSSGLTLTDLGGIDGLVRAGEFGTSLNLVQLLDFLDGYWMPELVYDGLFEALALNGFNDDHLESVINFGLIEMHSFICEEPNLITLRGEPDMIEKYELTDLGRQVIKTSNIPLQDIRQTRHTFKL